MLLNEKGRKSSEPFAWRPEQLPSRTFPKKERRYADKHNSFIFYPSRINSLIQIFDSFFIFYNFKIMKKLNKLEINPEKIMKNEDLISLNGGSNCWCFTQPQGHGDVCITGSAGSLEECTQMCGTLNCYPVYTPY